MSRSLLAVLRFSAVCTWLHRWRGRCTEYGFMDPRPTGVGWRTVGLVTLAIAAGVVAGCETPPDEAVEEMAPDGDAGTDDEASAYRGLFILRPDSFYAYLWTGDLGRIGRPPFAPGQCESFDDTGRGSAGAPCIDDFVIEVGGERVYRSEANENPLELFGGLPETAFPGSSVRVSMQGCLGSASFDTFIPLEQPLDSFIAERDESGATLTWSPARPGERAWLTGSDGEGGVTCNVEDTGRARMNSYRSFVVQPLVLDQRLDEETVRIDVYRSTGTAGTAALGAFVRARRYRLALDPCEGIVCSEALDFMPDGDLLWTGPRGAEGGRYNLANGEIRLFFLENWPGSRGDILPAGEDEIVDGNGDSWTRTL